MKTKRETPDGTIRFAVRDELEQVNRIRKQVNELHVSGEPAIFKDGFSKELSDYIYTVFADPLKKIAVCESNGTISAFAVLHHITKPENPFMHVRDYLDIDEFGVDAACRRKGIATEMIRFIREYAKSEGFSRIELNMWEFNRDALAFYEAVGFSTYRRYMETDV